MTRQFLRSIPIAFLIFPSVFLTIARAELPKFPDKKSFSNVSGVNVEILTYDNMSAVAITPADIKKHVIGNLEKAGVRVSKINRLVSANKPLKKRKEVQPAENYAILGIRLIRTEDSALFGATKIGSVAVTMHLFQQVIMKHNQHSTHAITWSETRSVSGASKRPKKIFDAVDQLLEAFTQDFIKVNSVSN